MSDRARTEGGHGPPPRAGGPCLPTASGRSLGFLLFLGSVASAQFPATRPAPAAPAPEDLTALLSPIREKHGLPALGAAIVRGEKLAALGAVGVRRQGDATPVTPQDLWHIGSCTKSMTATLIARLVDRGTLSWTTTLADVFPEIARKMSPGWEKATLEMFLAHRAGAPSDLDGEGLWARLWKREGTPTDQRRQLLEGVLAKPPVSLPGTKFLYANAGFAIAGAMAEKTTGKAWEVLMQEDLFGPIGMKRAGFGAPGEAGRLDEPRGHVPGPEGPVPAEPGPAADNPPAIAPAGTVHAALEDWASYAALHLAGARGKSEFLKPETWKRLHTPPAGGDYAFGWVVRTEKWAGGRALWHNGSNTMWFAEIWIAPDKDAAILCVTNCGGAGGEKGCAEASSTLARRLLPEKP